MMMMMMMMIISGNTAIASRCLQKDQSAILYSAPEPPKYSLTSHDDDDDHDDHDDHDAAADVLDDRGGGIIVVMMVFQSFYIQYSTMRTEEEKMQKSIHFPIIVEQCNGTV